MSQPSVFARFIKEPVVQLVLLGGCIFAGYQYFQEEEAAVEEKQIHVESAQIQGMIMQWEKRWNRPPTRAEIDGLVQNYVREEVLYRQAVAMGLDKNDPITRRRTVQKLEFLTNDVAMAAEPSDAELEQFLAEHADEYRAPDRITFLQVFFNPDDRGESTIDEAKGALAALVKAGEPDPETTEAGDRVMLKGYFDSVTPREVARQMGSGFAESLMELEPASWHGPVLSGYGVHLVYVYEAEKGEPATLDSVREKVVTAWYDQKKETLHSDMLENLKKDYQIVIDEVPEELIIAPRKEEGADAPGGP